MLSNNVICQIWYADVLIAAPAGSIICVGADVAQTEVPV